MKITALRKQDSRVQLFLRIKHCSLAPREISQALHIEPDHAVPAGESVSSQGKQTVHSETYWLAQLSTPTFPVAISPEDVQDYKALLSTASVAKKVSIHERQFERNAYVYQGLSKAEILETIGASPIELVLVPWLRRFAAQVPFIKSINADGGSVTLIVQLRKIDHPVRIRPSLARRLADAGIELEVDWSN
jgi:hypothetical protein